MNDKKYKELAIDFIKNSPYKTGEFSGKNWGHEWHSLCSYQGKLKPAIAYNLVSIFTEEGDLVLDPLCGVGTIPFEACMNGRVGIGNDLSELAYVVSCSKLQKPLLKDVYDELAKLNDHILTHKNDYKDDSLPYSDWGFNGKLPEYYETNTYKEILAARDYYKKTFSDRKQSSAYCLVLSCMLHILHGNRPYALSRNSHPLTPYKPTGDFVYKSVYQHVLEKIEKTYKKDDFSNYKRGLVFNNDFIDLPKYLDKKVDWIITSPPFTASIRFYINNWLRLWFVGWEPLDFKKADSIFLDGKQNKNLDEYIPFFETCSKLLKPNGRMILHLGKTSKVDMAEELMKRASQYFVEIYRGDENVDDIEHHGIKDKGGTFAHQFLFLKKK